MKKTAKATKAKSPAKKTAKAATTKTTAKPASKTTKKPASKTKTAPKGAAGGVNPKASKFFDLESVTKTLLKMMERKNSGIDPKDFESFKEKINYVSNYTPTICVFGQVGAGKSSLCNTLFGEKKFEISAVQACTKDRQHEFAKLSAAKKVKIIDMPGVGESEDQDAAYLELYRGALAEADLILWALKADSRAYAADLKAWGLIKNDVFQREIPTFFILTQADKMDPVIEWDHEQNLPGATQMGHLLQKKKIVAGDFGIESLKVIPISSQFGYGIKELTLEIISSLPDNKKAGFFRVTTPQAQSEESSAQAQKGFFNSVWEFVKKAADTVKEFFEYHEKEIRETLYEVGKEVIREWLKSKVQPPKRRR
jgi:hypothetical protein